MFWAEYFGRRYLGAVRSIGFPIAMGINAITPLAVALSYDMVGTYDYAFYTCAAFWAGSAILCLMLRLPAKRRLPLETLVRRVAALITPGTHPAARPASQKRE